MSTTGKLIKISFLIRKQDNITTEEFHRYWSEEHPKLWLSVAIVKEKVVKYSQFHFNNSLIHPAMGLPMTPYDGAASMWLRSMEDLLAVFTDPEYQRIVVPDEQHFFKREGSQAMIGWEDEKWVDGKQV